jgi:hypothetical protein
MGLCAVASDQLFSQVGGVIAESTNAGPKVLRDLGACVFLHTQWTGGPETAVVTRADGHCLARRQGPLASPRLPEE